MTAVNDKMVMLIAIGEQMYSDPYRTSKRIGKIMLLFARMFTTVGGAAERNNDKHRFLSGSLYALGGLLKTEAKSYIMTLSERYTKNPELNTEKFKTVAPLTNPENPAEENEKMHIRHISEDDEEFFKKEFYKVVIYFMKCISTDLVNTITNDNLQLLLDLT